MVAGICYLCGKERKRGLQKHHVIPQAMKPVKNDVIPLCKNCHKKLHKSNGDTIPDKREVIYFMKVKKNGKTKVQGNISNGKIIFPDFGEQMKVKPNKYYDVLVHQIPHVAFARDMKEVEVINKE